MTYLAGDGSAFFWCMPPICSALTLSPGNRLAFVSGTASNELLSDRTLPTARSPRQRMGGSNGIRDISFKYLQFFHGAWEASPNTFETAYSRHPVPVSVDGAFDYLRSTNPPRRRIHLPRPSR